MSNLLTELNVRTDFPLLNQEMNGHPVAYLDNAATTQKPKQVSDRIQKFYEIENATVHRGVYSLSQEATQFCDVVRSDFKSFINAKEDAEIIFVKGTTEAINLVASSYVRSALRPGDEILITAMEHHANIVPWQQLCEEMGFVLKVAPINDSGELELDAFKSLLNEKTKFVSVVHISNVLGTINPISDLVKWAHGVGAKIMIDGAQAIGHTPVDVQMLDCDFYAFSGHKMYGPTGIGLLYGKRDLLDAMPPYQFGGDMIRSVSFEKTTFAELPLKFEAGTPAIAQIIGWGAALTYLKKIGLGPIAETEHALLVYGAEKIADIDGIRLIGTAAQKSAIISFVMEDVHPHDVGSILDQEGIAVRVGHHCAQPLMSRFGVPATVRASFSFYNTTLEIDRLCEGLKKVRTIML